MNKKKQHKTIIENDTVHIWNASLRINHAKQKRIDGADLITSVLMIYGYIECRKQFSLLSYHRLQKKKKIVQ